MRFHKNRMEVGTTDKNKSESGSGSSSKICFN